MLHALLTLARGSADARREISSSLIKQSCQPLARPKIRLLGSRIEFLPYIWRNKPEFSSPMEEKVWKIAWRFSDKKLKLWKCCGLYRKTRATCFSYSSTFFFNSFRPHWVCGWVSTSWQNSVNALRTCSSVTNPGQEQFLITQSLFLWVGVVVVCWIMATSAFFV